MFAIVLPSVPLLTWTPVRNRRARIYRTAADRWMVLIRDTVYDGAKPVFVSQRDFEMLTDAEVWAQQETGHPAKVAI